MAMLVALVTGGYHSYITYTWSVEDNCLVDEIFPVSYVTSRGTYKCTLVLADSVKIETRFQVKEGNEFRKVNRILPRLY